ncbi:Uncharacterized protein FKW44_014823 [Caligus rogercresseyi]|uniref:Uncharacterized protein n=1 Tax=Caligus rogercresseyi TaxID=217165 RepID=A0A7T8JZ99_CALRO|nr:Uncharacterized protein FKW44_014823 [Caligus rogercresseyi]
MSSETVKRSAGFGKDGQDIEERVGRQSTRDEKLYGFHPQSKILRTTSKAIAKFQTLIAYAYL